jgi:hypothetical protein
MKCPVCNTPGVQCVIDAYVVFDDVDVSDDGASTVGPPRVETFDDAFLECRDCGWKDEGVEVQVVERRLTDELQ